jgi:hypothetical protein
VSFFAGDRLKQVSLADGGIRDLATTTAAFGASWLSRWLAALCRRCAGTDSSSRERIDQRRHEAPSRRPRAHLPDGRRLEPVIRLRRSAGRWPPYGATGRQRSGAGPGRDVRSRAAGRRHLLHVRDGVLLSQRLNPETRQRVGKRVAARAGCRNRSIRTQLLRRVGTPAHLGAACHSTASAHVVPGGEPRGHADTRAG